MQRRATSKKRAAEAKREVDMGDKEATPVENIEVLVAPVEQKQPAPPEEQPEVPTETVEVNVPEREKEKSNTNGDTKMDRVLELSLIHI